MTRQLPAIEGISDSAAIAASIDGPESFSLLFDRHYPAVHRYLARRAPAGHADDLASATFVVAFERRQTFRADSASARPWLLGIATNLLHDRYRRERRELGTFARLSAEQPCPATGARQSAEDSNGEPGLAAALASLDPAQRDALLLYAWEELSYEEIADALDVPVGTVRSRLSRAREHLRSHLEAAPSAPRPYPCQETK
jgi:RNA polymerase sigma factor (sigma-70 family)